MELTNQDIEDLVGFRRELHRFPEISNEEKETAERGADRTGRPWRRPRL
jgi:metal-dependent amidase/aminoacylase/carboxypeptidase family protein